MSAGEHPPDNPPVEPLTRRESEVLVFLDEGFSAPEIAEQLHLAVSSVKWHIQQIYGKLGVNTKRQALTRAKELGLLGAPAADAAAGTVAPAAATALPLTSLAASPETPAPGESPFKGLRHFDEADAAWFFGREALTAKLVARLDSPTNPGGKGRARFLAVVGASGSGKSSIVRAGVIPAFRRAGERADGQAAHFEPIHLITPTAHPLEALAIGLTRQSESVTATATLMDDLARDERALHLFARRLMGVGSKRVHDLARQDRNAPTSQGGVGAQSRGEAVQLNAAAPAGTAPAPGRLLLVVDQFEELFTLCRSEPERQAFIDNLLRAAAPESDGPTTVLITLRADFYPHCAAYAGLREALGNQQEYIGPMSADELRQAVELPAQRGGWEFEPGLVDLILRDVGREPGMLPLLSHALLETWQHRRGRTLTLRSYAEAGGVQRAIATTAETVYQSMPPADQAIARGIFLRLTELGEGTQDTRRRVALGELLPAGQSEEVGGGAVAGGAVANVLQTLSDARLITQDEGAVEVAHEALIREWPTLRQWLSEDRDGLRLHRRLTEEAQEWDELERDPSELLRGPRLAEAVEWAEWSPHSAELNALELAFVQASRAMAEREAAEREAQRQRELEAARGLAEAQRLRAEAEAQRATEQAQAAGRLRARNRLITAVGVLALLAAIAAGFFGLESNRNVKVAQSANTQSAQNLSAAQAASTQAISQLAEAQRQSRLAYANQLAAQAASLLNVDISLAMLLGVEADRAANTYLVRGTLQRILTYSPHLQGFLIGHTDSVNSVAFSPDGKILATSSTDATIRLWNVATHQPAGTPIRMAPFYALSLAYSPDGKTLAAGTNDNSVRLWDVATSQWRGQPLAGHTSSVSSVAISPDGKLLASGSNDKSILLWDMATGQPLGPALAGHTNTVSGLAFSPDGKTLASSSLDGTLRLWDLANDRPLGEPLTGTWTALNSVDFSPDGRFLASGSKEYDVLLWDSSVAPPRLVARLNGHTAAVNSVAFSPDGSLLASASADYTVRLWNVATRSLLGVPLVGHNGPLYAVAFSPGGKTLATGSSDQTVGLWQVSDSLLSLASEDFIVRACGIAGRNMRRDEWNLYLTGQAYHKTCEQWPDGN